MRKQVEAWQRSELTYVTAKVVIYEAFVEASSKLPSTLPARARSVLRAEIRGIPAALIVSSGIMESEMVLNPAASISR